ncbi:octopamine receptor beta-1R-like [Patiria miniata]|uniref:G-protein coupled receptors family 1 profile domain-containing protein n=1 Tax=Patiria miniata TaxID=46514 RepID=A0A913ZWQ4_PATMI|nr:octopamine receptor beta-1R-like [Patiria miniata]
MVEWETISELIIGLLGIAGNFLVCLSIIRAKFMHNITNYILLSLAIADFVVCLNILIFNKYVLDVGDLDFHPSSPLVGEILCQLFDDKILVWWSSKTSVMHLMFVAIERFVAIVQPLRYKRYFTVRRLIVLFVAMWLLSLLLQLPYMLTPDFNPDTSQCDRPRISTFSRIFYVFTNFLFIIIPSICTLWCYWRILKCLRTSARTFLEENNRGPGLELLYACRKVVQTLFIVYVAFIILWFPNLILGIIYSLPVTTLSTPPGLNTAFKLMAFSNSVVNPFIYGFKYRQLRKAFKVAVMPCCCNTEVNPNPGSAPYELSVLRLQQGSNNGAS